MFVPKATTNMNHTIIWFNVSLKSPLTNVSFKIDNQRLHLELDLFRVEYHLTKILRDHLCDTFMQNNVWNILHFISFVFCWKFYSKNQISERQNHQRLKYLEIHSDYKKFSHTILKISSAQIKTRSIFSKETSFRDLELFREFKTTNLGVILFHKKINAILFFKCGYFIAIWYS